MKLFNFAPVAYLKKAERHARAAVVLLGSMSIVVGVCCMLSAHLMYRLYAVQSDARVLALQVREYERYSAQSKTLHDEYEALKTTLASVTKGERSLCAIGAMLEAVFQTTKAPLDIHSFSGSCDELSCMVTAPSLAMLQKYKDELNTHARYHVRVTRLEYHDTSIHASLVMKPTRTASASA